MSTPPNEFEERLARDFPEPEGAFSVAHITAGWPEALDAAAPHIVRVGGRPVGIVHVEVAVSLRQFRESHRLLTAVLDVLARFRTAAQSGAQGEVAAATLELFAAGTHVSKHLADTDTALTIAHLEAKAEGAYPMKPETH